VGDQFGVDDTVNPDMGRCDLGLDVVQQPVIVGRRVVGHGLGGDAAVDLKLVAHGADAAAPLIRVRRRNVPAHSKELPLATMAR
jgi:hypothetical protein